MNSFKCVSRKGPSAPLRSWIHIEKPPAYPRPGIAGDAKAKATASWTVLDSRWLSRRMTASAVCCEPGRSDQFLSATKYKPLFVAALLLKREQTAMVL